MIRKSLEIIRCSQCHYMQWTGEWPGRAVCVKMDNEPRPSFIHRPGEIPNWCPLEDWPEE